MIFPDAEFRTRAAQIQAGLLEDGLDALLLTASADIFYVTGFLTRFWESPTRPWFVIVPSRGALVAVIPSIGAALMTRTWLRDIRTWDAPRPADDGVSLLVETLGDIVPEHGKIGLPIAHETLLRMPLADLRRVESALAPRSIVDATGVLRAVREVKSAAEVALIRETCGVADRAFARVGEIAGVGVALDQVFRDFQRLLLEEGADWVAYLAGAAGAEGYSDVISPATPAPLASGDVLMLDTGAVRAGYYCDFDRNWSVGPPSAAAAHAQERLWRATEAGLDAARPGATAADLHRAMAGVLGGLCAPGRLGHGLGISLTETPSLSALDQTELRPGMVLTLEPACFVTDDRIMVHEENIVIRDSGAELLTARASSTLPEL